MGLMGLYSMVKSVMAGGCSNAGEDATTPPRALPMTASMTSGDGRHQRRECSRPGLPRAGAPAAYAASRHGRCCLPDILHLQRSGMQTPANIARHPFHPMLVTVPVGLWVMSLVASMLWNLRTQC